MEGEGWLNYFEIQAEPANHKFPVHPSVRLHTFSELRSAAWMCERLKGLVERKDWFFLQEIWQEWEKREMRKCESHGESVRYCLV